MIDFKKIQETASKQTIKRIKKAVRYVEKRISKAAKKGGWEVAINWFHDKHLRDLPIDEARMLHEYFTKELGFPGEEHKEHKGLVVYSWKLPNHEKIFVPCTEDSKLKHVVLAGEEPRVMI